MFRLGMSPWGCLLSALLLLPSLAAAQPCDDRSGLTHRLRELVAGEPGSAGLCELVRRQVEAGNAAGRRGILGAHYLRDFEKIDCRSQSDARIGCRVRFRVLAVPSLDILMSVSAPSRRHLGDRYLGIVLQEHRETREATLEMVRLGGRWYAAADDLVAIGGAR